TPGQLLTSLKPVRTLGPFPGPCLELRYTSNGQLVAVQQDDQKVTKSDWFLTVIDPVRNTIVRTARIPVPGAAPWRFPFSVSADARLAAVAPRPRADADRRWGARGSSDGTLRLYDLATGKELRSLQLRVGDYDDAGCAFTPDGKHVLTSTGKSL